MQTPEREFVTIVMVGSFNPAIFQPKWLGTQQLIRPEEADEAKIAIIQADVADFSTEWFQLQVLQRRLSLTARDPTDYQPLRDLASSLFVLLPHTPVEAIGLNRAFHFELPNEGAWHGIGHLLAPKEHWHGIIDTPGLRSMTMQGRRAGSRGTLRIKVEPSANVKHGLYVEINEEFKQSSEPYLDGAQWIPSLLAENWDAMMEYAEMIAEGLLKLANS